MNLTVLWQNWIFISFLSTVIWQVFHTLDQQNLLTWPVILSSSNFSNDFPSFYLTIDLDHHKIQIPWERMRYMYRRLLCHLLCALCGNIDAFVLTTSMMKEIALSLIWKLLECPIWHKKMQVVLKWMWDKMWCLSWSQFIGRSLAWKHFWNGNSFGLIDNLLLFLSVSHWVWELLCSSEHVEAEHMWPLRHPLLTNCTVYMCARGFSHYTW